MYSWPGGDERRYADGHPTPGDAFVVAEGTISPLAFPDVQLTVADILPGRG